MDKPIVLWGGEMELSLANNLFIFKNWKKIHFCLFSALNMKYFCFPQPFSDMQIAIYFYVR